MKIGITVVPVLVPLPGCILLLIRPRLVTIDATIPENFPADRFSHRVFEDLLQSYVDGAGDVDCGRWQQNEAELQRLDSYLAAVSLYSPESSPHRFDSKQGELAYWLYAYNAYVIRNILGHWTA